MRSRTVLHYDNTFEGLLTCIFEAFAEKFDVYGIVGKGFLNESFDMQIKFIETSDCKSQRVSDGIVRKIGKSGMQDIFTAFASCNIEKGMIILNYLKLVFSYGRKINQMLSHKDVVIFNEMLQRVKFECHRFHGFVRFSELEFGIFAAPIRPDNDILELIFPHFVERFGTQKFAIVDVRRKKAGFFDGKNWDVGFFESVKNFELSEDEKVFRQLWKDYYETVTIAVRKSERRRKQFMPKRYWEFMPEINSGDLK